MQKNRVIILFLGVVIIATAVALSFRGVRLSRWFDAATTDSEKISAANKKLSVTTSFYPLYFFASVIGGDKATIHNITPAGAEPHDYEPTVQNIIRLQNSRLLIMNGGKLEAWGDKIQDDLKGTPTIVIRAAEKLATQTVSEEGQVITDPHVWLDPLLAKQEVDIILPGFIQADAANRVIYESNAKLLQSNLEKLHQEFSNGLRSCQSRNVITSHAAFGYLVTRYNLRQVPIAGLSPDQEPSAKKIAEIANFAKQQKIKYIFFESLISPKLSETIAKEVGAQSLVLNPLEGLSDAELKDGQNYFTAMRHNLTNLRIALQCQ